MPERVIGVVSAGSSPMYEVVENDEGPHRGVITIRSVERRTEQIRIDRGAVPNLINVLKPIARD